MLLKAVRRFSIQLDMLTLEHSNLKMKMLRHACQPNLAPLVGWLQGNSDCISNDKDTPVIVAGTLDSHAKDLGDLIAEFPQVRTTR